MPRILTTCDQQLLAAVRRELNQAGLECHEEVLDDHTSALVVKGEACVDESIRARVHACIARQPKHRRLSWEERRTVLALLKGVSLAGIAEALGVTTGAVSRVYSGERAARRISHEIDLALLQQGLIDEQGRFRGFDSSSHAPTVPERSAPC